MVEVPEPPVMLVGDIVQERFVELVITTSVTVPANPLTGEIVTVEPAEAFTRTLTLVGFALTVKSWTVKETVAVCERLPLVPVTVTVTLPVEVKVHERVEEPDPETDVGNNVQAVLSEDKLTVPLNPPSAVMATADVPAWLTSTVTLVGLAETVKSVTCTLTVVVLDSEPLVLVTFAE